MAGEGHASHSPRSASIGRVPTLLDIDRVAQVATRLVDAGRTVPGLTVDDDGRARSWWWPLPSADDRAALRSLLAEAGAAEHARVADELAEQVDAIARSRLVGAGVLPRRAGRRTLPELWLLSLVAPDPCLPATVDPAKARALAETVGAWVASGRAVSGRLGLLLRVHEPPQPDPVLGALLPRDDALLPGDDGGRFDDAEHPVGAADPAAPWTVEVLVSDADDVGLRLPMAQWWPNAAQYGPEAGRELLADLARAIRIAPELAGLLDASVPDRVALDEGAVATLLTERVEPLSALGVTVLLPGWWTGRTRVGLRARARTQHGSGAVSVTDSGLGLDALVDFEWTAALGETDLTDEDLALLDEAVQARRELVRLRGQWVQVRPEDLRGVLARVGRRQRASARDLLRTGLGLGSTDLLGDVDGVPVHGVEATGWLGTLLDEALDARIEPVAAPPGFAGTLRDYQARGVGWITFLGRLGLGACLADDMGLGKTAQLIASLLADPLEEPTLVVAPVSVLGSWERELARFAPDLQVLVHHGGDRDAGTLADRAEKVDVVLTAYSLLARDVEALSEVRWGRLVLDEAQQVKNPGTAQAKAVRRLTASRRIALTGTPVENRLSELWSIMDVLSPGLLGSLREFRERFIVPIERGQDEAATQRLRRITAPFVLRRLKSDPAVAPDLPAKVERTDRCQLSREQATLYQAVVDELIEAAEQKEGIDRRGAVLAGLTKLKQVCNHPALLLGDGSALPGRSGKLTRIEELVEEIVDSGDRALLFTQYAEWGSMLAPHLSARFGVPTLWLHGRVPRPERDAMVARFQADDGPPLMLISLRAGGTGLTLTRANHVIHLDRWWNPAVEDQATDRAHRIGQAQSVFVHRLVTAGTVEERIDETISRKRALAGRVVGTGEAWLTDLSAADLRDAVALRDSDVVGDSGMVRDLEVVRGSRAGVRP